MTYSVTDTVPLRAPLKSHADAISAAAMQVSPKTIAGWPVRGGILNGKRQTYTADVWAYALAMMPSEDRDELLDGMDKGFAQKVRDLIPAMEMAVEDGRGVGRGNNPNSRRASAAA